MVFTSQTFKEIDRIDGFLQPATANYLWFRGGSHAKNKSSFVDCHGPIGGAFVYSLVVSKTGTL